MQTMKQNRQRLLWITAFALVLPALVTWGLREVWDQQVFLNEPIHSSLESSGSLVALVLGFLLLAQRRFESVSSHESLKLVWIASALFAMGILDGFHAILHVSSSFFWTHGFATFFGGLFYVLVWLPKRFATVTVTKSTAWIAFGLSAALGLFLDVEPDLLPRAFSADGTFSDLAVALNIVGGLGYLAAAFYFLRHKETGKNQLSNDGNLIFAAQCLMLGVAALLFSFANMWSAVWWFWHALRFISYLLILRYVYLSYSAIQAEVRGANEVLNERNLELAASNQELEAFCYSVSHDLRAPLRGIDGFSQALLEDYSPNIDSNGQGYIRFVREGVQKMGRLIDDLLNLSRYTRIELKIESTDLSELSEEILTRLALTDPNRDLRWSIQSNLRVMGDRGLIEVILENLLGNAFKFTSTTASAVIEIGAILEGGERTFYVRDNGAGFDQAYVGKLFGAFQRLHPDREFKGSGIGLATVRRIVSRHGGQVRAEGLVGQGATVFFTLPEMTSKVAMISSPA